MGDLLGNEAEHARRYVEAGVMAPRRGNAALEDLQPQLFLKRTHLDYEPAREPRTHTVVKALQVSRRTIGGDHHLPPGIDQRVERVAELDLRRLALEKLQIVNDEHVDASQRLLEGEGGLRFQRRHETVHEFLGGEVEDASIRNAVAGPRDRLQQMGLAEPDAGMDVEWVEHHRFAAPRQSDLLGRRMSECVRASDHECIESEPRVERRTAERLM